MCHTCINNNDTVCASCIKERYFTPDYYTNIQEVKHALLIGIIVLIIYSIFFFSTAHQLETINLLWSFIGGIAIGSGYYLIKNVSLYSETNKIPFIGFKLTLVLVALTFVLGIPIVYFIYKTFVLIKTYYFKSNTNTLGRY